MREDGLLSVILALSGAQDLDAVAAIVRERARQLIGCDGITFVLREGDQVYYRDENAIAPLWKGRRFPAAACVSGWAIQRRQTVAIEDVYADERVPCEAYQPTFVKSLLMTPIRASDPIGAIGAYWAERHRASEAEIELLQAIADAAALAVRNTELWGAQRAMQSELARREGELRLVTDAVPALISFIDADHRYRFVNRAYEVWFGQQREQILGRHMREVLGEPAYRAVLPALESAMRGEPMTYQAQVSYRTGGTRWIDASYTPHTLLTGEVQGVIALVHDVTEQKLAEQATLEARDAFLSVASHELKTPLTPINLQLQSIERMIERSIDGHVPVDRVQDKLAKALRQVVHLERLVNDLLDVSRLTGDRLRLELEATDLGAVAREVVERHRPELDAAGCRLELRANGGATGMWNRLRLDQVVSNLLRNAIKYGPGKPIEVALGHDDAEGWIEVRDHGIGIAPADQQRIFARFERAVPVRNYGGFGLGLWIAHQVVEALRGRIEVESAVGEGSTFRVVLPRA